MTTQELKKKYLRPSVRAWLNALRSGKYKQTKTQLCKDNSYCCLGVACEVAIKAGIKLTKIPNAYRDTAGIKYAAYLPPSVQAWLGIYSDKGTPRDRMTDKVGNYLYTSLTGLNDGQRYNFEQIADIIEQNLEQLFKPRKIKCPISRKKIPKR